MNNSGAWPLHLYEPVSKLLVFPLISPTVVPYIVPYIIPYIMPLRSLDYGSYGPFSAPPAERQKGGAPCKLNESCWVDLGLGMCRDTGEMCKDLELRGFLAVDPSKIAVCSSCETSCLQGGPSTPNPKPQTLNLTIRLKDPHIKSYPIGISKTGTPWDSRNLNSEYPP